MSKLIIASFLFMGVAFYELSGGAEFVPEERAGAQMAEAEPAGPVEVTADDILAAAALEPEASEISILSEGNVTLASATELDLDGVPARLTEPLVGAEQPVVAFASLAVTADGVPTGDANPAVETPASDAEWLASLPGNAEAAAAAAITQNSGDLDLRSVDASALNVRFGPSTSDAVVGKLERFEIVTVVSETSDGWAQIRIEGDGIEGWVASRFLTQ